MMNKEGVSVKQIRAIFLLAGLTAAVALVATVAAQRMAGPTVISVNPLLLLIAFGLSERYPVHLEYRREAQSFTLTTIPLVIGLFAFDPITLVACRLAGSLAVHGVRTKAPHKLAINLSSFWIDAAVAAWVFHMLAPADPLSPMGWLAALAAGIGADLAATALISGAITIFSGRLDPSHLWATLFCTVAALVDASLALVAVVLLAEQPMAVVLLLVVPAMLWASYIAYTRLREKHQALELLYEFTRSMSRALLEGTVTERLLRSTRELMHAETAWLVLETDGVHECLVLGPEGGVRGASLEPVDSYASIHHAVRAREKGLLLEGRRAAALSPALADEHEQILAAALTGTGRALGTLGVADRSGVVRPFNQEDLRLFETLAHQAGIALENGDLIEQIRHEAKVNEHLSLHDPLTGLPNRVLFDRTLSDALEGDSNLAVLLLDLDGFKEVNDTLGHQSGDLLLQQVAERLRSNLRRHDSVARLGGDEFAVLVTDLKHPANAMDVASALKKTLEAPFHVNELELAVGATFGVAVAPEHGTSAETLLQRADVAMYVAKADHTGIELYTPERDRHSPERLALVADLKGAVSDDELELHYQPQLDLASGQVIGMEALVRWQHPRQGFIPPLEFVGIAEHTGLISQLTRWVLDQALAQISVWRQSGADFRVAVNLSARNLLDTELADDIAHLLDIHQVPPEALCLEITETCAMADPQRTSTMLNRLSDLGVRLAVDDFGTGYSSLAYLRTLPVDEVKIDRSFVMQLSDDRENDTIVQSIVGLGKNLGMEVVAEGVEDERTLRRLRSMGCHGAQGYFICRPNRSEVIDAWLAQQVMAVEAPRPPLSVVQLVSTTAAG
jgi:diguanylate cyclase (GGDEF)-like protein